MKWIWDDDDGIIINESSDHSVGFCRTIFIHIISQFFFIIVDTHKLSWDLLLLLSISHFIHILKLNFYICEWSARSEMTKKTLNIIILFCITFCHQIVPHDIFFTFFILILFRMILHIWREIEFVVWNMEQWIVQDEA